MANLVRASANGVTALFKGVRHSEGASTPLCLTLPYFTQLKNAI
jgi:hypothetical protein